MNKIKILTAVLLFAAVLLTVSCSKKDDDIDFSTSTTRTSQIDLSDAVDAFIGITENSVYEEEETSVPENIISTFSQTLNGTTRKHQTNSTQSQTTEVITTTTTTAPTARETVRITIKEGMTLTEIFKKLDENGVASFDELMNTAQTYDYSYYPLIAAAPSGQNRCFKLEGYLFPNTYEFYKNQKPQDAIGKFLRSGKAKITDDMISKAKSMGYSMDEVITVASIIEKEGANSNEVAKIAAVIYNRLEAGMKLQMDSSIYYIERHVKPYIAGDINRYNSYYNTYKCSVLPAGPISNPGMRTINAALNPADVDYLYFCHDENANYYYAETYEEHLENLKKAGLE